MNACVTAAKSFSFGTHKATVEPLAGFIFGSVCEITPALWIYLCDSIALAFCQGQF